MMQFFDGHLHYSQVYLDEVMASFAEGGVAGGINLWGGDQLYGYGYRSSFEEMLKAIRGRGLKSFIQFYWPNWGLYLSQGKPFIEQLCRDIRRYADLGCRGLKVWKDFGMYFFKADGSPAVMDEPDLNPVWKTCADVGWTISVHQADPTRAWTPGAKYFPKTTLTRPDIFRHRDKVIESHPEIPFILCHGLNYVESLELFGQYLDAHPHVKADLSPIIEEWATPQEICKFLEKYAGRLYIGSDMSFPENRPPDRPWNLQYCWMLWQQRLEMWKANMSAEAFELIRWGNGQRDFKF
jgi:hypothetical protein